MKPTPVFFKRIQILRFKKSALQDRQNQQAILDSSENSRQICLIKLQDVLK